MPIDFDALSNKVKSEHDQKLADQKASAEAARRKAQENFDRRVQILEQAVIPHLDQAAAVFKAQGIDVRVRRKFEGQEHPRVLLEFYSPKRKSDGYQKSSLAGVFVCYDKQISAGLAEHESSTMFSAEMGRVVPEASEPLIEKVVEAALADYYKMMEHSAAWMGI